MFLPLIALLAATPQFADADRAQKLGEYCRFNNSLPRDLSELAICLVGRHFKAQYEFYAHARLAKEAGLSPAIVEAVRTRQSPPFPDRHLKRRQVGGVTQVEATTGSLPFTSSSSLGGTTSPSL